MIASMIHDMQRQSEELKAKNAELERRLANLVAASEAISLIPISRELRDDDDIYRNIGDLRRLQKAVKEAKQP